MKLQLSRRALDTQKVWLAGRILYQLYIAVFNYTGKHYNFELGQVIRTEGVAVFKK